MLFMLQAIRLAEKGHSHIYHIVIHILDIRSLGGHHGHDRMEVGFTTTYAISHFTTKVVSSNPVHVEVYSIQHYVIKFVSYIVLATDQWFSLGILVSSGNKTDHHDITEILLKVALITLNLTIRYSPMTNNGFFLRSPAPQQISKG